VVCGAQAQAVSATFLLSPMLGCVCLHRAVADYEQEIVL
jgi:hypothetical protein